MHARSFIALGFTALATLTLAAGCSSSEAADLNEEAWALAMGEDDIAGAWVSATGDVAALVFNPGDSRLEATRQAFTAVVKVSCPPAEYCKPRYTVEGTWTLEGERLRLTNFRSGPTPESTVDVGRAAAMRRMFGEHRIIKQGDKLALSNATGTASFAYHGTSYCDDYVASQCMYQFPVCEGRNVPSPHISEWKSLPRSGKCLDAEKRCELICDTSYRGQELAGKEFVIAAGDTFEIFGATRQSGVFSPERYEWNSESPLVVVKTKTTSEPLYPLGTYDLRYRFNVDKNAPRGSVHRVKHAISPWTFTIRVL